MLELAFRLHSSLGSRQGAELHSQHRPSCREFVPGAAPGITCASGNPCLQPPATRGGSSPLAAAKGSPATQPPQHCRHTNAPGTPLPGVPCPLCHAGGLQNLLCTHLGPCSLPASALRLSPKALGVSTAHSRPDSASCPGTLGTRSAPPDPPMVFSCCQRVARGLCPAPVLPTGVYGARWAQCPSTAPSRSPRTYCSAPCSPGGFGPASSTLGPAAAPRLPSPFHGGQLWCGLPASGRDGGAGRREHPSCGTARHGSPARPPCRGRVISCCVAADLRVKALRGPRGRLPASGRFLSWLWDREGRPRAPSGLRHLPPALGLSAPCRDGGVGSLSSARPGDEGGPGTCRRDGGGGSLCVVAQGDVGPGGCRSLLKQPGTQKPLAGCGPHPRRWAPSP